MSSASTSDRRPVIGARLKTMTALFVCAECSLGRRRRREFKHILKAAGRKREVRIVRCGCLDLCPKRGTAIALAGRDHPMRVAIVDDGARAEDVLTLLLHEGVSNAIPD